MAVLKCKMCGGDLNLIEGASTAECEFCGSIQTIPKVDDEKKLTLFARANRLRAACEFDKAAGIYESIVADFPEEAEAYWGLVLCKYGIEYVDDPGTVRKIPTCHRSSFESVLEDSDFEQALENADGMARRVYREEAKQIEELRKGIIAVSADEEPYDVFICYKETDESGNRTIDSVLAQDVYDALTDKGYRVFFSRITLEDKLGVEYEPYIFAALNSAKIMLAFGTDYEYFTAVWVKNEWSRYLKLMAKDKTKHLIPCFKGIDVYDMPKEFARLQAQDLGKVGATQDLLRGIEKILPRRSQTVNEAVDAQQSVTLSAIDPLLRRVFMFLEDGNWKSADEYCEKVLDMNPECAEAYLGKLMAELCIRKKDDLRNCEKPFDGKNNYQKVIRFADSELREMLIGDTKHINDRNENARKDGIYRSAVGKMNAATTWQAYREAETLFRTISTYKDSAKLVEECRENAESVRKNAYDKACKDMAAANTEQNYTNVAKEFETLGDYADSQKLAQDCRRRAEEVRIEEESGEDTAETARKNAIYASGVFLMNKYMRQVEDYQNAIEKFRRIPGWKDADEKADTCQKEIEKLKANADAEQQRLSEKRIAIQAQKNAWRNAGQCQHCGGELKGFFSKKCVRCGKTKDY